VNWDGIASFDIDADELEHRVITVVGAQKKFEHDVTIVAEIHMMNLNKVIAVFRFIRPRGDRVGLPMDRAGVPQETARTNATR
jgi:hypothetical protein